MIASETTPHTINSTVPWQRSNIQVFTALYSWDIAWRDTVLIGNMPTSLMPFSHPIFRRGAHDPARLEPCLRTDDMAWGLAMPARYAFVWAAPATCPLRTRECPCAA